MARIDSSYNAIFGRPAVAKFMVIPHHSYMVLKMPGPKGVLSIRGDFQQSHECDQAALAASEDLEHEAAREEVKALAAKIQPSIPAAETSRNAILSAVPTK